MRKYNLYLYLLISFSSTALTSEKYQIIGYYKPSLADINTAIEKCRCHSSFLFGPVIYSPKSSYEYVFQNIKDKNPSCLKKILNNVVGELSAISFPKECLLPEHKTEDSCKKLLLNMNIIENRVQDLLNLIHKDKNLIQTEANSTCFFCKSLNFEQGILELKKHINNVTNEDQCYELKPGEERNVTAGTFPEHFLPFTYTVKRNKNGSYTIPLYISFTADEDYEGPVPKNQAPNYYRKYVQSCIETANKKLLGPKNEKLIIDIQPPAAKQHNCSKAKDTHEIKIGNKHHRTSSIKYSSSVDCPAVVHEILHLLGLVDEYKEKKHGHHITPDKDILGLNDACRVLSYNSIMSQQNIKWFNTIRTNKHDSLLSKGQFQSILYGDCPQNNFFNKCAKLAYIETPDEKCLKQKEMCESKNSMGHDKKQTISVLKRILLINTAETALIKAQLMLYKLLKPLVNSIMEEDHDRFADYEKSAEKSLQDSLEERKELIKQLKTAEKWED